MSLVSRHITAPITALATLATVPDPTLLAGSHTDLLVHLVGPRASSSPDHRCCVLQRDSIHHLVVKEASDASYTWHVLVAGGKEAAWVSIVVTPPSCEARDGEGSNSQHAVQVAVKHHFKLDDWILSCAFLRDKHVLFVTAHNSLQVFSVPTFTQSTTTSGAVPSPHRIRTYYAPLRPLLWSSDLSRSTYTSLADVRIASGSILGDVLVWGLKGVVVDDDASQGQDISLYSAAIKKFVGHQVRARSYQSMPLTLGPAVDGFISSSRFHQGSIFTIAFSPSGRYLLTGSDDRTLRIWDAEAPEGSRPLQVLWGHLGRIWRARWIDEHTLMSIAEDASVRVWSLDHVKRTYRCRQVHSDGHDGRSLWAVTSCTIESLGEDLGATVIFSGGADGAVRCWPVARDEEGEKRKEKELEFESVKGVIKAFSGVVTEELGCVGVFFTGEGLVYSTTLPPSSPPQLIHTEASIASIRITSSSTSTNVWIFSNSSRCTIITLSRELSPIASVTFPLHPPTFLHISSTLPSKFLVTEQVSSTIQIWSLDNSKTPEQLSTIPTSLLQGTSIRSARSRIASAAFMSEDLIVLGTRVGELVLVRMKEGEEGQILFRNQLHSDAINGIKLIRLEGSDKWDVETVSRSGSRSLHRLVIGGGTEGWDILTLSETMIVKGAVDGILEEGKYLTVVKNDVAIVDVNGTKLETFSATRSRSSGTLLNYAGQSSYYRIDRGKIFYQTSPRKSSRLPLPIVLRGHHGREIRSVASYHPPNQQDMTLLATGAENSTLTLSVLTTDPKGNRSISPIFTDTSLPTSVKTVSFLPTSEGKLFLLASGSQELLRAWKISFEGRGGEEVRVLAWGEAEVEGGEDHSETRIMDHCWVAVGREKGVFAVIGGYSDGSVKVLYVAVKVHHFDTRTKRFVTICESWEKGKCVLTTKIIEVDGKQLLFTGRSDGLLSVWDIARSIAGDASSGGSVLESPLYSFHAHQSGINGLDTSYDAESRTIRVATGGDDNAVHVHRFEVSAEGQISHRSEDRISKEDAHASTIQGICFLSPTLLASSAVDQRLNIWEISTDELRFQSGLCLGISDCSTMDVRRVGGPSAITTGEEAWEIVLAGIGIEVVEYTP